MVDKDEAAKMRENTTSGGEASIGNTAASEKKKAPNGEEVVVMVGESRRDYIRLEYKSTTESHSGEEFDGQQEEESWQWKVEWSGEWSFQQNKQG